MAKDKDMVFDKDDLELYKELENSKLVDIPLSDNDLDEFSSYAKQTKLLKRKKQTTIRFNVEDLAIIKAKANDIGIGYQNLIQTLVHKYAQGKIKIEV